MEALAGSNTSCGICIYIYNISYIRHSAGRDMYRYSLLKVRNMKCECPNKSSDVNLKMPQAFFPAASVSLSLLPSVWWMSNGQLTRRPNRFLLAACTSSGWGRATQGWWILKTWPVQHCTAITWQRMTAWLDNKLSEFLYLWEIGIL